MLGPFKVLVSRFGVFAVSGLLKIQLESHNSGVFHKQAKYFLLGTHVQGLQ